MKAVLEISMALGSLLDVDDVLQATLDGLFKVFPQAEEGFVILRDDARNDIFQAVAAEVLAAKGYELFVPEVEPTRQGAVDYVFGYSVQSIKLTYPDVGRTLGIWRRWVAREVAVSVLVEISEEYSGRLLLSDRIERRFGDRFDSDNFADVDTDEYEFTTAETSESGWKSRMEEIVVLGTLAGLVAIYFANTGD